MIHLPIANLEIATISAIIAVIVAAVGLMVRISSKHKKNNKSQADNKPTLSEKSPKLRAGSGPANRPLSDATSKDDAVQLHVRPQGALDVALVEIARTHPNYRERISAIKQISNQDSLTQIALSDSNNEVSSAAVERITDQTTLGKISRTHDDPYVRKIATQKLTDQATIAEVAQKDNDWRLRGIAVGMLADEDILAEIAMNDGNEKVRDCAFDKIKDERILERLNPFFRSEYTSSIDDQSLLAEIAKTAPNPKARVRAVYKLSDQTALIDLVRTSLDPLVRRKAVMKINNPEILREKEKEDADGAVRELAAGKLTWRSKKDILAKRLVSIEMEEAVDEIVQMYPAGPRDDPEYGEWIDAVCAPMSRSATYAFAKAFHDHWRPGQSNAEQMRDLFTHIEELASPKLVIHKEGTIREGWMVWERFQDNEVTPAKGRLRAVAQSARIKADVIQGGFAGWMVYGHKETAEEIAQLLQDAGADDPGVRKVRVFMSNTDPRIGEKARIMENGAVLEYIA
jgi:flagellar basal body-associated protein FliL